MNNLTEKQPRFTIGTTFKPKGKKSPDLCTVTDIHTTRNFAGEIVRIQYVATHQFCGQTVTAYGIPETTVARGLINR